MLQKLGAKGNANHYYIPESMSNNWKISWKLPLLYYMIMTDKYMIYPSMVSLSTTLAPPGENIKDDSLKYMYNVKLFDDIDAKDTMLTLFDNDSFGDFALVSIHRRTLMYCSICPNLVLNMHKASAL
jgi:hypothetical protein